MRACVILLAFLFGASASVAQDRSLFDILDSSAGYDAYLTLIADATAEHSWLTTWDKLNGSPTTAIEVNGTAYEFAVACNADDCEAARVLLLFTADGRQAWGLLKTDGDPVFLGEPNGTMQDVLVAATFNYF